MEIVIRIKSLHPAIIKALAGRDCGKILAEINELYAENDGRNEVNASVKSKDGKTDITFVQASKVTAKLPKDKPAAILARVHWFLHSSREYFTKIESVELPHSVAEWAKADKFNVAVPATV